MLNENLAPWTHRKSLRLAARLTDEIKSWIVGQNLGPGASLPSEAQLMAEFGCSRSTVREALRILESEGLIRTKPGPKGGIYVTAPDHQAISRALALMVHFYGHDRGSVSDGTEAILEARIELEAACARLAARNSTPEDLDAMRTSISRMEAGLSQPGVPLAENLVFHIAVARATHSPILWPIMLALEDLIYRMTAPPLQLTQETTAATVLAHRRILAAIEERDGELAVRRMRVHLGAFRDLVLHQQSALTETPS